ncbi:uncharacterized protein RHO25_008743 [Cercospora beticola]|uniref:Heterokaryon incompatibility domain-containing protein n=1 Tax=Cercospora beticola TaxID=122368 RepID=A0ABZ0NXF2_CERBT|nr:hypothetical protein RHO25_008743 [Cercospora beticola]
MSAHATPADLCAVCVTALRATPAISRDDYDDLDYTDRASEHHSSLHELRASSDHGCPACTWLWLRVRDCITDFKLGDDVEVTSELRSPALRGHYELPEHEDVEEGGDYAVFSSIDDQQHAQQTNNSMTVYFWATIGAQDQHPDGTSESGLAACLREASRDEYELDVRYMTMSHRWFPDALTLLSKATLPSFREGIPIENLKTSVRDAMSVAQRLGIPYLWVDSLCIVQDNPDELGSEIMAMDRVYGNSFCNISAASENDSAAGLFFDRDPRHCTTYSITLDLSDTLPSAPTQHSIAVSWDKELALEMWPSLVTNISLAIGVLHYRKVCCGEFQKTSQKLVRFPLVAPSWSWAHVTGLIFLDERFRTYGLERWAELKQYIIRDDPDPSKAALNALGAMGGAQGQLIFPTLHLAGRLWTATVLKSLYIAEDRQFPSLEQDALEIHGSRSLRLVHVRLDSPMEFPFEAAYLPIAGKRTPENSIIFAQEDGLILKRVSESWLEQSSIPYFRRVGVYGTVDHVPTESNEPDVETYLYLM